MPRCEFTDGLKRILQAHPALPAERTRELAAGFRATQDAVCAHLAALAYPLERVALELKAGSLPFFREGSDQDRKHGAGRKAAYRFAGFAPSHLAEFEDRLGARLRGELDEAAFAEWEARFLRGFTFEVIEQVSLRATPPPVGAAGEPGARRRRAQLADALDAACRQRDEILTGNLLLVAEIAIRRGRCYPSFGADDLFAAGTDGLMVALNRYDATVGHFSTYATPWVKMAIDRHVAKTRHVIRVPIGVQDKARRESGRPGEGAPGAGAAALIPDVQSLEDPLPGLADEDLRLADVVADPAARRPAETVEQADIAILLEDGVRKLDRLKQFIIALRNDVGDAAALGAALFREEMALSLARGRATSAAAAGLLDVPARIRMIEGAPAPADPAAESVSSAAGAAPSVSAATGPAFASCAA